jgi:hypothetical protein
MIVVLGFDSRWELGIFLFTTASTQPPIQGVLGALSLGVKRSGREADHSSPINQSINQSNKEWGYTTTPQYAFLTWCSVKIKHRKQLATALGGWLRAVSSDRFWYHSDSTTRKSFSCLSQEAQIILKPITAYNWVQNVPSRVYSSSCR